MKDINKYTPGRLHDWIVYCDICGNPWWASECITLAPETGRGGCLVCPRDADPIDPGLVPYKIRVEKPLPFTNLNNLADTTNITNSAEPYDLSTNNPMSEN